MSASRHQAAAITGIGVIAPLGIGREAFWANAVSEKSALTDTPTSKLGVPVPPRAYTFEGAGIDLDDHGDHRVLRRFSRYSAMTYIAAKEAFDHASLAATLEKETGETFRERSGVILGTAFGSAAYHFEYYESLFRNGIREASPLLFSESVLNAASGHITQQLGLRGPGLTLVGGEDIGLHAMMTALDMIRRQETPCCLAGGGEEYCDILHTSLARGGFVGADPGMPYKRGCGPAPFGEGAAFLVLEDEEFARQRQAPVLAYLRGVAMRRSLPVDSAAAVVANTFKDACKDAGIEPDEIDLVVGSGVDGTIAAAELGGLASVLSDDRELIIAAPKALVGEAFGFSSVIQMMTATQGLSSGSLPPCTTTGADMLPKGWRFLDRDERVSAETALVLSLTRLGGCSAAVLSKTAP